MSPWIIVTIVLAVLAIGMVVLYFFGEKMQKKQMAQREQMAETAQQVSMLIIDKKFMKMKDAKLPKIVMEQTPKRYQNSKLPIVKAKVGPQILTLIADDAIFDELPTKGEVKAMVSGIYIISVKNVRGKVTPTDDKKKSSWGAKLRKKQGEYQKIIAEEEKTKAEEKAAKARAKAQKEAAKRITK
ncbi:MAG: hypothetical protein NC089_05220 [Bacteroides sp.]|nr:hypothetical protein [Bacteroides sp.]MCM1549583.1 hypothetical protein [Clostridium sp.]